ncbi:MAG: TauD/TfdA family dioxygenase [Alphaproteobacteria bacterium]|nr:TauD/TfdA family dioxygenase [Alphaproteobacteria bacterium]
MLQTRPLGPALGVEVLGLDLSRPFDPATAEALRALYRAHHLILVRDQRIDEPAQVRFAELVGPISHRSPSMRTRNSALVSNVEPEGILGDGKLYFHHDNTFYEHPLRALSLYAIELPSAGGDTLFSNCAMVYDALPEALRSRIERLSSYQMFDFSGGFDYNRRSRDEDASPQAIRAIHPLVWTDPDTGRKVVFMSEHTTVRINEVDDAEGEAIVAELARWIADPRFGYRHRWRLGDVILWDNIILQHAREPFDKSERRTLRRTPIAETDGPRRFPGSRSVQGPMSRAQFATAT